MRAALDLLYRLTEGLAALFLAAIALLVLGQVISRTLGSHIPSMDEIAGYCLAATSFLALAPTFRRAEHIRVSLLVHILRPRWRWAFEFWCLMLAAGLAGYFAWYCAEMVWFSYRFNDVSQGLLPIPLWLPQSGIALGLWVMTVALLDDLVTLLRRRRPSYLAAEDAKADASRGPMFER